MMDKIDNNELKFRMITPDGKSFPVILHLLKAGKMIFGRRLMKRNEFSMQRSKRHLHTAECIWEKQLNGLN